MKDCTELSAIADIGDWVVTGNGVTQLLRLENQLIRIAQARMCRASGARDVSCDGHPALRAGLTSAAPLALVDGV